MGCLPECTNLFCLTTGVESLALDGENHELFEMVGRGIGEASLPIDHGAAPDTKHLS